MDRAPMIHAAPTMPSVAMAFRLRRPIRIMIAQMRMPPTPLTSTPHFSQPRTMSDSGPSPGGTSTRGFGTNVTGLGTGVGLGCALMATYRPVGGSGHRNSGTMDTCVSGDRATIELPVIGVGRTARRGVGAVPVGLGRG